MLNKKILALFTFSVLCALFLVGVKVYDSMEQEKFETMSKEKTQLFVRDYSPVFGDKEAKVTLIEFLDPECESCRAFYPAVKQLMKFYEGKLKLVVRYAPFHRNSVHAIKVLEATRKQDKYWESLEILFKYQPMWASHHDPKPEKVFDILPDVGVDIAKLKEDMKDPKLEEILKQEVSDLKMLGVRATPTFFVNGRPLEKFSFDHLRELVDSEVKKFYKE
ncbi:thioredoxin domain-containing protein [Halobacteriovorax sp. GB3]|uniref:DsbA family protein n=1 Tax=Halobacteriovorax sp. GB3 TaxID=2719615 RepID=UPI00235E2B76|nr:thioredoxin domain-containing protein [Halobacteriovorax sp. GB3]MDD0851718.1 thioredoxin domain-containing protein [Halobacteriovorax sp. GB3]